MSQNIYNADLYLITYPRSGKNWTEWYIKNNTDINIYSSHYVNPSKITNQEVKKSEHFIIQSEAEKNINRTFSIVRNPIESIVSINIMEDFANEEIRFQQYIDHYEFLLKNNVLLFDFKDISTDIRNVANILCNKVNKSLFIKDESFENYSKWHLQTQDPRKIISSKNNKRYKEYLNSIDKNKMKYHFELYEEAKNKCYVLQEKIL